LVIILILLASASSATAQSEEGSTSLLVCWTTVMVVMIFMVLSLYAAIVVIKPWEIGLKIILGKYGGKLMPGLNFVPPFITKVIHMDLRDQVAYLGDQEVLFRDKSKGIVELIVHFKVIDPEKAAFQVEDFKLSTLSLARTTFMNAMAELTFDELLDNRKLICEEMKERMRQETDPWGVKVDKFEILEMREN